MASQRRTPPWKRPRPARKPTKLSSAQKNEARARAGRAGRRYPNLVDNMTVTAQGKRAARRKRTTKAARPSRGESD